MSVRAELWRGLRRDPGLSALIALTVALGVGVATALFGYFESWLHPRIAAPHPERIANVRFQHPDGAVWHLSSEELEAVKSSGAFELVLGHSPVNATVVKDGNNQFAWGQLVQGDYFELYAGRALLGRLLAPEDDRAEAPSVVVLSHRLWRIAFAADPAIVGRSLTLNREPFTVVGVLERGFEGVGYSSEFFVPARFGDGLTGMERATRPDVRWLTVRGRLPAGEGAFERARASLIAAFSVLNESSPLPEGENRELRLLDESSFDSDSAGDPYFLASRLLAGAGALFVLLGATNLAGLLLARAAARDREWAVRKAIGASPARLAGAIVGRLLPPALVGLAGAFGVARLVEGWMEATLRTPLAAIGPGWAGEASQVMELGWRGYGFALLATVGTLLLAAAPPFLRVLRRDPNRTLRAESAGGGSERAVIAPRRLLVATQLAVAVTLLVASGLLVRSFGAATRSALGFDPGGITLATVNLPRSSGASGGAQGDLGTLLRALERVRAAESVESAALALVPPLSPNRRFIAVAKSEAPDEPMDVAYNIVSPGYFETLGVSIASGRALDDRDSPTAPPAVVVSAALAERLWGREPAVGRRLHLTRPLQPDEAGPDFEVVGVAADAAYAEPLDPRAQFLFFVYGQRRHSRMTLLTRARVPLAKIEPILREIVASARSDASLIDLVPADEQLRRTLHPLRLYATVASGLGVAGLGTALLGLFALQAYTVNLRRRDFAVRMVLGARSRDLSRLVLSEAARLALLGLLLGLAAAAALARLLDSLLYGVTAFDPWTFAAVPLLLGGTVLIAGWLPARRAARVDPLENLRSA